MSKLRHKLPLSGHALRDVEGDSRFTLVFDDPAASTLRLDGPFILVTDDVQDTYTPPCPEWVREALRALAGVAVATARYSVGGVLALLFQDGRELRVPDGPYENWHYQNREGRILHGGVGRIA